MLNDPLANVVAAKGAAVELAEVARDNSDVTDVADADVDVVGTDAKLGADVGNIGCAGCAGVIAGAANAETTTGAFEARCLLCCTRKTIVLATTTATAIKTPTTKSSLIGKVDQVFSFCVSRGSTVHFSAHVAVVLVSHSRHIRCFVRS